MGYSKKELIAHIAKSKKVIRLLKKLQRLDWSTVEVGTWEFIEREENDLAIYKRKLKNKEYIK